VFGVVVVVVLRVVLGVGLWRVVFGVVLRVVFGEVLRVVFGVVFEVGVVRIVCVVVFIFISII
jgi:hypothetical protein